MTAVTKEAIVALQGRITKIDKARQELDKNIAVAEEGCKTAIARLAELGVDVANYDIDALTKRAADAEEELEKMFNDLERLVIDAEKVIGGVENV